jgi:hypothetical protein
MRRYLDQLASIQRRAACPEPTWPCDLWPSSSSSRRLRSVYHRHPPPTYRGLPDLADRQARLPHRAAHPAHPRSPPRHPADVLRRRSATGIGPKHPPESRSSPPICPARTTLCRKPSTTRPQRNCYAPRRPSPACSCTSWWKCCCAPDYASESLLPCKLTRSCSSAPRTGCTSPSGSSASIVTCRCTRLDHTAHVDPGNPLLLPGRTAAPWTGTPSPG